MARFTLTLILMLVALSAVVDRHAIERQHVITGTVRQWTPGQSIVIANEQTDPTGLVVHLRNTRYEGGADGIAPGANVTVSYRSIGESQPVADNVRVNP